MKHLIFSSLLVSAIAMPSIAKAEELPHIPFHLLTCKTISAEEGTEFDVDYATVVHSSTFTITNSERRLKFHNSLIAFGFSKAFQITQPKITKSDMVDKSGRFGDLRARQKDDDVPTGFTSKGIGYEIQAVTGYDAGEKVGRGYRVNPFVPITVKIEEISNSIEREPPVWVGECNMTRLARKR